MDIYKIPVSYQMWGVLNIKANSLEEAKKIALAWDTPLPKDAEYVSDSISIDTESALYGEIEKDKYDTCSKFDFNCDTCTAGICIGKPVLKAVAVNG